MLAVDWRAERGDRGLLLPADHLGDVPARDGQPAAAADGSWPGLVALWVCARDDRLARRYATPLQPIVRARPSIAIADAAAVRAMQPCSGRPTPTARSVLRQFGICRDRVGRLAMTADFSGARLWRVRTDYWRFLPQGMAVEWHAGPPSRDRAAGPTRHAETGLSFIPIVQTIGSTIRTFRWRHLGPVRLDAGHGGFPRATRRREVARRRVPHWPDCIGHGRNLRIACGPAPAVIRRLDAAAANGLDATLPPTGVIESPADPVARGSDRASPSSSSARRQDVRRIHWNPGDRCRCRSNRASATSGTIMSCSPATR